VRPFCILGQYLKGATGSHTQRQVNFVAVISAIKQTH